MTTQELALLRPLTPFFKFTEAEKKSGKFEDTKKSAKKWNKLKRSEKDKYISAYKDAKEKYDNMVAKIYGVDIATYKPPTRPAFLLSRVRGVLGQEKAIKAMSKEVYPALEKVLEQFMTDLGKACADALKSDSKKVVTVEVMVNALEGTKPLTSTCSYLILL